MFKVGSIFIPVTNLQKSIEWYESNLGMTKIGEWDEGAGFYLPNSPTQIGLVQVESPQPTEFTIKGSNKNVYYNFIVEDIDATYRQLNDKGVITTEIEDFGGMKGFDFFDLDGNPFSVVTEDIQSSFHRDNVKKLQKS
ncbi:glyoxalase [Bacillus sp. LL01]|uniref:VOC family protein n=1 Tax=Bacillus sp. LL01 TaxID=1665556 RepID=UPI00064D47ED|nr:VOC family protein [Bacillus sp. LL01]KMJ57454.1 glyoxalase [Bacillus sp. LL01]